MPKTGRKFYAVANGRNEGVYTNWADCKDQVHGFKGAKFKSFATQAEAQAFVNAVSKSYTQPSYSKPSCSQPYSSQLPYSVQKSNSAPRHARSYSSEPQVVYTDGSSLGNGRAGARAGWGVYWGPDDERNDYGRVEVGEQTNNRGELMAIKSALETIEAQGKSGDNYEIRADSEYSKNALTTWGNTWESTGWRTRNGQTVKNQDLIRDARATLNDLADKNIKVDIQHIRGHAGHPGNEAADELARRGAA